jgi:hypothetical protein
MANKAKLDASARNEKLQLTAGAVGVAQEMRGFLPRMIALQRALDGGGVRVQKREIERLAKKHGDDHPRVREAQARIDALQRQHAHFDRGLEGLAKAVDTFATDDLFHGYVVDADGAPARGYTVRLGDKARDDARLAATTDGDGYFRIDLGDGKGERDGIGLNSELRARMHRARTGGFAAGFEAMMGTASGTAGAEAPAEAQKPEPAKPASRKRAAKATAPAAEAVAASAEALAANQADEQAIAWPVRIDDANGKQVYADAIPFLYTPGRSIFRYYALP